MKQRFGFSVHHAIQGPHRWDRRLWNSRRVWSATSEQATRQLLLCYHRNPPPTNQSAACWLRLNHKTTFWTHVRDDAFKTQGTQESRDTQADTSALSSSGFCRERNRMMHRTLHVQCCWCCRAHRDVPILWDHRKWMNKTILTMMPQSQLSRKT